MGLMLVALSLGVATNIVWAEAGSMAQAVPPALTSPAATSSYALLGVTFQSPEPFSAPLPASQEGVSLLYPATATPGNEDFRLTLRSLAPKNPILDSLSDTELQQWVRFTQLGLQRQVDGQIERTILGRRLVGDLQIERSRRQTVAEHYILPLSTGHRLLLSFEANQRLALPKLEALIGSIASTMQELPRDSKAWKNSFRWDRPAKR